VVDYKQNASKIAKVWDQFPAPIRLVFSGVWLQVTDLVENASKVAKLDRL